MKAGKSDWYKEGWSLDIKKQSWTEHTKEEVNFLIKIMQLSGKERILDLACGYGRHALEFARRGYEVVGVDITKDYVEDACKVARQENLPAQFYLSDIRKVNYNKEFDVVLNMADGAIGYLENDNENLKIFDVVEKALKPGGYHFMDIMSADYADEHFPCKLWDAGSNGLTLSVFEWNRDTKILMYGQKDYQYGQMLSEPVFAHGNPTRLYHSSEVEEIMRQRGMCVQQLYEKYDGTPASTTEIQMMVLSKKL